MQNNVPILLSLICLFLISSCSNHTEQLSSTKTNITTNTDSLKGRPQIRKIYSFDNDGVHVSNLRKGTRLNGVSRVSPNHYQILVSPEFTPVHSSSFYAFQLWSDKPKTVKITLKYTERKHRYVPKLSTDKKNWRPIKGVVLSQGDTMATFKVTLNLKKQWVAAQEIESSDDTYAWMDKLISKSHLLQKRVVGKTALKDNLYVISSENENIKPSLILIARQHPPEIPGGTIAFKAFFEELVSSTELAQEFRSKFNLYAFPLLNPDGANNGQWRHNANGKDLNRDWINFSQPETRSVRDFVNGKVENEGKTVWFGIDFHTAHNGPYFLIFNEENEKAARTKIIPNWINSVRSNSTLPVIQYRRRDQTLPYCSNWFFNAYGAEGITYEDGDEVDRSTIKARATLYAQKLMETMLSQLTVMAQT